MHRMSYNNKIYFFLSAGLILLSLISIFAILWVRANVVSIEYRLGNLEEKKKILLKEKKILLAEKASLSSIVRFDNQGNTMVFPDRKKVVYIAGNPQTLIKNVKFSKIQKY
ncbi:hypothetical protein [Thermodesulfovibrio hydrogeniphilus]